MASCTRFSKARRLAWRISSTGALVALQPSQRAIQVDVGGVKKFEHHFPMNSAPGGASQTVEAVSRIAVPYSMAEVVGSPGFSRCQSPRISRLVEAGSRLILPQSRGGRVAFPHAC